jgi:methyl-accepting chemotaxis protein
VGELVGEISAASTEQSQGIDQINKAVSEMDKVVQQTASNAEQSAGAAQELNAQAEELKKVVHSLVKLVETEDMIKKETRTMVAGSQKQIKHVKKRIIPKTGAILPSPKKDNKEIKPEQVIPFEDDFQDF